MFAVYILANGRSNLRLNLENASLGSFEIRKNCRIVGLDFVWHGFTWLCPVRVDEIRVTGSDAVFDNFL